ncbi:shikimate dehydrogenase [Campylobacter sp. RM16192]|uniref:shikimate dehydrogenase n=1 Tax=Campylobacter sp. RM16192 TaxID=1660080 RepID=UPI00145271F3|nr:shikimate dehydrogenase [Campylobacter sp. RM16192]QCD53058.1 shikimate dehydrogenase [Campylobacter sp. RM16192]
MQFFAVFGNPIKHSFSPRLHNLALQRMGLDGFYIRVLLEDGNNLVAKFKSLKLSGANITIPHKEIVLNQCDVVDENALKIGSINTIVLKNDQIYGYNTDAPGFMRSIEKFGSIKTALILGAGGTAKAIAYALKNSGANVTILNRSKSRLENFSEFKKFTWDTFTGGEFQLIVNTTSAGLNDDSLPAPIEILEPIFKRAKFAFDVIYNKPTSFLNLAIANGIICKNGSDMLLHQAVLALNLFYSNSLDEKVIENHMREAFSL